MYVRAYVRLYVCVFVHVCVDWCGGGCAHCGITSLVPPLVAAAVLANGRTEGLGRGRGKSLAMEEGIAVVVLGACLSGV